MEMHDSPRARPPGRGRAGVATTMCLLVIGAVCGQAVAFGSCADQPRCGDGVIDVDEVCDDGNTRSGDGCRADCAGIEVCGDGLVDPCEECDHGGETADCDADCTRVACGDGTFNRSAGELCSDDAVDDIGCFKDCPCPDCCGNGRVDPGEECDDGQETASCDADCTLAECGDGHENATAGEECDWGTAGELCGAVIREGSSGNRDDMPDACRVDCRRPRCGDGVTDAGDFPGGGVTPEECDDGGQDTHACDADCTAARCGDGHVNPAAGEACDGDGADTVDCDADCTPAACGDGHLNREAGEQCETHADCPPSYGCELALEHDGCVCAL